MDERFGLEQARHFLQIAQDDYLAARSEGMSVDEAMNAALDGWANPVDMLGLIWASGALDEAWEAAQDSIEQAIISCDPSLDLGEECIERSFDEDGETR